MDPMVAPEVIFEKALKSFERQLNERQIQTFSRITIQHVQAQIIQIQADQDRDRRMMDFTRFQTFLEKFGQYEEACNMLQINTPNLSAYIWGPSQFILQTAKEDTKALDCILDSYRDFGRHLPFLRQYRSLLVEEFSIHQCIKTGLAWIYYDLMDFYEKILKFFESRSWKKTFVANWKDYEGPFQLLLGAFDYHGQFLKNILSPRQHSAARESQQRLNDHVIRYQDDREELNRHISDYERDRISWYANAKDQETQRRNNQYVEVIRWLRSLGSYQPEQACQEEFRGIWSQYPKTGGWVLGEDKIHDFIHADTPKYSMLWMTGKKGAGKTILASIIIDYLMKERADFNTSFFYCKEKDRTLQESHFLVICKSFLRQLTSHSRDLLPTLHEKKMKGQDILDNEDAAKGLIELFCDTPLQQFIIIDGLDELELEQRKRLVQFLDSVIIKSDNYTPGKIRVLLISTDLGDMRSHIRSVDYIDTYEILPDNTDKDIKRYFDEQAVKLKEDLEISDEDLSLAESLICKRSKGMFLFAFLVLENLLSQPNLHYLREELRNNSFPTTLQEAYDKIITRLKRDLNPNSWAEARKIFGWLACAKRPLEWHELQAALTMVQVDGDLEFGGRNRRLRKDFRHICGSLIRVFGGTSIEFVHQTARDCVLKSEKLEADALECDLALLCLNYLSHPCFQKTHRDLDREHYARNGYYAFQDYAVSKWGVHLESLINVAPSLLSNVNNGQQNAELIARTLNKFYLKYQLDFQPTERELNPDFQVEYEGERAFCQCFQGQDVYDYLVRLWRHVVSHQKQLYEERSKVSIKELSEILELNRAAIEEAASKAEQDNSLHTSLTEHYGDKVYKCMRVDCDIFYEGLDSQEARERHVNQHERPFQCNVPGCSLLSFGFSTNKDLEKHLKQYHADIQDQFGLFPPLIRTAPKDANYQCNLCDRSFVRNEILIAHKNSTHFGVRPYACPTCGKAFTRKGDRTRHERMIHARRGRSSR